MGVYIGAPYLGKLPQVHKTCLRAGAYITQKLKSDLRADNAQHTKP